MSSFRKVILAAALAAMASLALAQSDKYPGLGRAATPKEVAKWDIDVRPDFKGLPPGSGSVAKGQDVWEGKCAHCHGIFGESNEVFSPLVGGTTAEDVKTGRVANLSRTDFPGRTTLMKVATVSTLWDYINRAMPWNNPKTLSTEEVYAVTAFLLNLGNIVPDNYVLSDKNIAEVQARMPNRNGMTTDHGMWPGAPAKKGGIGNGGIPDVKNVACMKNCKPEVQIGSTLPDYARTAHGELADQNRNFGAVRGTRTLGPEAAKKAADAGTLDLATKSGCMACHGMKNKIVGPGYNEIVARYQGQTDAESRLVAKVKAGGQGVWGSIPMPPNAHVKDEDIVTLVKWILNGSK